MESSAGVHSDDEGNQDSLWSGVYSIARINARSLDSNHIQTAIRLNEVTLKGPATAQSTSQPVKTSVFDSVVDNVQSQTKDSEAKNVLSSQADVWDRFREASTSSSFQHFSDTFAVIAIGGPASGKSHCLFGDLNSQDSSLMGLVPRYIYDCFCDDFEFNSYSTRLLQISMCLVSEEHVSYLCIIL